MTSRRRQALRSESPPPGGELPAAQGVRTDTAATRARIVAAAERLFAARGIDDVSLQEINRAARQKNRSAVQYHFGNKEGLVHAILDKHTPVLAAQRREALDGLDKAERRDLRILAEILVLPAAAKLDDPDGGIAFLRVNAELLGHPDFPLLGLYADRDNLEAAELQRLTARACPHLPKALWFPRWLLVTGILFHGLSDFARLSSRGGAEIPMPSREVFVSSLVDSVVALLEAPASKQTRARLRGVQPKARRSVGTRRG